MTKCRTVIYINKDDPRVFVYKHRRWKWWGVTLNFARPASFVIIFVTVAPIPVLSLPYSAGVSSGKPMAVIFVFWIIAVLLYYFRGARKDLERHPGNPSVRD